MSSNSSSNKKVTTMSECSPSKGTSSLGSPIRMAYFLGLSLCLVACLFPGEQVEAGRLQDFIQNLVGGGNSNSNSNNNNNNNNDKSNSNSNSDSNSNNDADSAASGDSNEQTQQMNPMIPGMNPFLRYPSFYDNFGPSGYGAGAFSPMSAFSNPIGAMSSMSPMALLSGQTFGGAFSPASFAPATFAGYGSSAANPMGSFGTTNGMSASQLSNVYATSAGTPSMMAGYTPYYGRRR